MRSDTAHVAEFLSAITTVATMSSLPSPEDVVTANLHEPDWGWQGDQAGFTA